MIELTFIALEFWDFGTGDDANELLSFVIDDAVCMHNNGFGLWPF